MAGGQAVTEKIAVDVGIHRRIDVLVHESLAGPMTSGVRHPAIVFSPGAHNWHHDDLNRAIVHELWQNVFVEYFAKALEETVKQPVIDKTGINGMYDFELKFGPHGNASEDPIFAKIPESYYAHLPDIFTVLKEKLGLKLVPEKVTLDTLVIDHLDKVPTEN